MFLSMLLKKIIIQGTYVILNFVVAILKKKKETGKTNFNNILYVTQYIQNVITSTCNQCKVIKEYVIFLFFVLNLLTPKGYFTLTAHLSIKCSPATCGYLLPSRTE